ncbi:efflux RND transporter periplasmic adaptor subunit (plasmid) [Ensifer adhaerens]|uniref:HlyD family secretion protein n=1 Tax=Ensifer adhaerens TaxID=106592 RepID=UPI0023A929ED|nr:efflux RND transporter periplasmic adaptor subunit [Ensifer adhaerens]WDZ79153.1 efflux RND transporter periplasmic adaptor subunit [Ensifer adhaerens]
MVETSRSASNGVPETDRSSDGANSAREKTTERDEVAGPNIQLDGSDDPESVSSNAAVSGLSRKPPIAAAFIVAGSTLAIVGLSLWYLVQPQPLLVQGEADATRIDIAARVDGRIGERPVSRGEDIKAGQTLASISNPELLMKLQEAEAARAVALADLNRIEVGTRAEVIAQRKAAVAASEASLTLAQQTYDRTLQLTKGEHASVQNLDQATANLDVAKRSHEQAKLAYEEAVAGYTTEERGVATAAVAKAEAAIATLKAQVAELTVTAPVAGQVYQIATEPGEYVSPGVPLLSLVDLSDIWVRFDLREDLVKGLKVGDHFQVKIPALGDTPVEVEVHTIATRGEYAGWRATRATGDFDLRTFEVRAYPVEKIATLRPGMSAYADWADVR